MKSYVYRVAPILEGVEDEIYRDILIQEDKTLVDFHFAILDAYGLQEGEMASFYTCTENWEEGLEITLMDMGTMEHESVSVGRVARSPQPWVGMGHNFGRLRRATEAHTSMS